MTEPALQSGCSEIDPVTGRASRDPLFSVVIPLFNREALIEQTLDSVLRQAFQDFEVIVVDDGSTDRSCDIVSRYVDRVTLVRQANQGPGVARNLGSTHARGRYLVFLDSDDLWFPWTLDVYAQVILSQGMPSFLAGCCYDFSEPGEVDQVQLAPPEFDCFRDYLSSSRLPLSLGPCMVIRRDVFNDVGGYTDRNVNCEDHDLNLRIGVAAGFVRMTSPPTVAYRRHTQNLTNNGHKTLAGGRYLMERERAGAYPGGQARRQERIWIITRHVRPISLQCLARREFRHGWNLYRETFQWHLELGWWRYLAGMPLATFQSLLSEISTKFSAPFRTIALPEDVP